MLQFLKKIESIDDKKKICRMQDFHKVNKMNYNIATYVFIEI